MAVTLRFPTDIDSEKRKNPWVFFKAYDYFVPGPNIEYFDKARKRPIANFPEIAIYMPGNFSENVNASWSPENILQGGNDAGVVGTGLSIAYDAYGQGSKVMASLQAGFGAMPFPNDINIFRGIDPMSFPMSFKMIPNSEAEAIHMIEIAKTFKLAIMPTNGVDLGSSINNGKAQEVTKKAGEATKNTLLKFPCVWDIQINNMKGLGLEDMKTSIYPDMCLTNVTVDYTSDTEGASVFEDGMPTGIVLNLAFTSIRRHYAGRT